MVTQFGLGPIEIMLGMISLMVILLLLGAAFYGIYRWKQLPYRIVLKDLSCSNASQAVWQLQRRDDGIFEFDWLVVFESANKKEVQIKAREALFSHYRFNDFVNERDTELIGDGYVIADGIEISTREKG